uniref:NYN domain-containing protein n=2 Tax=Cajanus cajan TaxID=3821 RepID=A0A151TXD8_CAJCA|nr:hypothetical protein KK1_011007 [Cajanus cajan]
MDKCRVPKGQNANSVAKNITTALVNMNYVGPLTISAYGDTTRIPRPIQHALSSTGVSLNHVPSTSADKRILVDMLLWAVDNPAPANYLLISGDREFSNALHQLSMRRYNILLAQPPHLPRLAAARLLWHWATLSAGGSPFCPLDSKPKYVRKSSTALPLQMPNPPARTQSMSLFKAPHEFFPSKCNLPVIPTASETSSRENQPTSNPIPDMPRLKLNLQETRGDSRADYDVEGLIDVIMRALEFLKVQMIVPSEANITCCIRYGDPRYQMIDVRKALDFAIQQRRVGIRVLGALHLYHGTNHMLYKCVNHTSGQPSDFPQPVWDRVEQFLRSSSGRSLILVSRCRYEASLFIKRSCLEELVLGDVLKILEMIINVKEWIIHSCCGWQPITITLAESKGDDADSNFGVHVYQI